ncbi:response regulator [Delftia tsuruhatensis]|uniref:response regulator n=1 Tax=Delftia tsuruhatensis TaxID=180282 RepID=UPI003A8BBFD1
MRILVVDDDSDIAETMAALLEMDGAEASPCTSAREALKKLAQGSWNVVLLDIGMPEMDGVEVAQVIRDSALGARLFIVAITGHSCRIPYDHMVACETGAGGSGTNLSWPASAYCS